MANLNNMKKAELVEIINNMGATVADEGGVSVLLEALEEGGEKFDNMIRTVVERNEIEINEAKSRLQEMANKVIEAKVEETTVPKSEFVTIQDPKTNLVRGELLKADERGVYGTLVYTGKKRGLVIRFSWGRDENGEKYEYPWFSHSRPLFTSRGTMIPRVRLSEEPEAVAARNWIRATVRRLLEANGINW
jgi:hypothetical protein